MKKIYIALLLGGILLAEIILGVFMVLDIQVLKFPQTTIAVDLIEITPNEALLHHTLEIRNPNSFEVSVSNLQIIATTDTGEEVARIIENGGSIPSQGNRTFSADDRIAFAENTSGLITSTITGTIGVTLFGFLEKTVPLDVTVITSFKEPLEHISLPTARIRVKFGTITYDDVELNATITVSNPNSFEITLGDVLMTVNTDEGKRVGSFDIQGATLTAENTTVLTGHGTLLLEALNAKILTASITADVKATVAGISKTLPFSSALEVVVPDLASFIPPDTPLEFALDADMYKARGGLQASVTLEVINPTKILLVAHDIVVDYYRVIDHQKFFIAESVLGSGELAPEQTTVFSGDLFLPYNKIFNVSAGGLLPDMMFAQLRTNISLFGMNQGLPIAIGSYIDLHLLRLNR